MKKILGTLILGTIIYLNLGLIPYKNDVSDVYSVSYATFYIRQSGGDFLTLNSANVGLTTQKSLVDNDQIVTLVVSSGASSGSTTINKWQTDVNHPLRIWAEWDSHTQGRPHTGAQISPSIVFTSTVFHMQGMEIITYGGQTRALYANVGSTCIINDCIFVATDSFVTQMIDLPSAVTSYMFNCIFASGRRIFNNTPSNPGKAYFYNCTFSSYAVNSFANSNVVVRNCIFANLVSSTLAAARDTTGYNFQYNSTDISSFVMNNAPAGLDGADSKINQGIYPFKSYGTYPNIDWNTADLTLQPNGENSASVNYGIDLSTYVIAFFGGFNPGIDMTKDINGITRPAGQWSMGASQYTTTGSNVRRRLKPIFFRNDDE